MPTFLDPKLLDLPKTSGGNAEGLTFTEQPTQTTNTTASNSLSNTAKFSDVTDITLESLDYYPISQPFLPRVWIRFPKSLTSNTDTSTSNDSVTGTTSITSSTTFTPNYSPNVTDDILEIRPQNLVSFDFQRTPNATGQFTLVLFDSTWSKIEDKLINLKGFMSFKYGYDNSPDKATSEWFNAKVTTYSLDFQMQGATIIISGLTLGYEMVVLKGFSYSGAKDEIISDIVKNIAGQLNYDNVVEPTAQGKTIDSIDKTDRVNKIFIKTGQSVLNYLKDLSKYAVNEEGRGGYIFYVDVPKNKGKPKLHFHTLTYDEPKTGNTPSVSVPAFTMFKHRNNPLKSFKPNWSMSIVQIMGTGGTLSTSLDCISKNTDMSIIDLDTNPQKYDNKAKQSEEKTDYYKKSQDKQDVSFFYPHLTPARTKEENDQLVDSSMSKKFLQAISAEIEIIGSPNFQILDKIAVIVYIPQQVNLVPTTSNTHWISGYFRILGIHESIRAGSYLTTMQLGAESRLKAPDAVKTQNGK